ncbi:hypothetical protein [Prochlorococcus marinus]|nr:hypothetical protein [Prochlorococcus marinus]
MKRLLLPLLALTAGLLSPVAALSGDLGIADFNLDLSSFVEKDLLNIA